MRIVTAVTTLIQLKRPNYFWPRQQISMVPLRGWDRRVIVCGALHPMATEHWNELLFDIGEETFAVDRAVLADADLSRRPALRPAHGS